MSSETRYHSAVVADTLRHAEIVIGWAGLNPNLWKPVAYGERVVVWYQRAILVRPLRGPGIEHLAWLERELQPHLGGPMRTLPPCWEPTGSVEASDPLGYASMWS